MSATIYNSLILQETSGGSAQIKAALTAAYGPHQDLTAAQSALVAAFSNITNIPKGYTFCVLEDNKPVEYWFIMNGVNTNTTPFAQQIEKKQKEATVDLSDLSFRTVTENGTTYLEVSTDGTNYTRVGTLPTSSGDITQLQVKVCTDPGEDYGQIQVSYQNGAPGSWRSVGARDDSRLKPLTDLQLSVDEDGQLQVYYGEGTPYPVNGAIFNYGGGSDGRVYIIDYNNAPTITFNGQVYTGQDSVNVIANEADECSVDFNIWMTRMYGLPIGTKVILVSTIPTPVDIAAGVQTSKYYYLYQVTRVSNSLWTGNGYIGKLLKEYYTIAPFDISIDYGYNPASQVNGNYFVEYRWDHGSTGAGGYTPEHENLTQGVTIDISSAVPFKMWIPQTLDDDNSAFYVVKQNGTAITDGAEFPIGTYHFTVDVPTRLTNSEYQYINGSGEAVDEVKLPKYLGMITLVGVDENTSYYGSIALQYYPYIDERYEDNVIEYVTYVKDRYTNANLRNAEVFLNSILVGRTGVGGAGPILSIPKNASITYGAGASGYTTFTSQSETASVNKTVTMLLEPTVADSTTLKIKVEPANATIWIDGVKQSSAIIEGGVLSRRISLGEHSLYITAPNYEPHSETISVTSIGYESTIALNYLGYLTYTISARDYPHVPYSGGTDDLVTHITDNYGNVCTILKVVPATSYDDFTVNSMTAGTGDYDGFTVVNMTFPPYSQSSASQSDGRVTLTVYYMGTDGTTMNTSGTARRNFTVDITPYSNDVNNNDDEQ